MKTTKSAPNQFRLFIGHDAMNGFDGLSDGDLFRANDLIYQVRMSTEYGITLRPYGEPLGKPLPGFVNLPDYFSFVQAVNDAACNGLSA